MQKAKQCFANAESAMLNKPAGVIIGSAFVEAASLQADMNPMSFMNTKQYSAREKCKVQNISAMCKARATAQSTSRNTKHEQQCEAQKTVRSGQDAPRLPQFLIPDSKKSSDLLCALPYVPGTVFIIRLSGCLQH